VRRALSRILFAVLVLAAARSEAVVNITVVDGPGEGFNDPTVVAPVPGNPATTRGVQRLNALQAAADQWDAALNSPVPIEIHASFDEDLACGGGGATLGVGGPATGYLDITPPPGIDPTMVYPIGLANKIVGVDLCPSGGSCSVDQDINIRFNSLLDTTCSFPDWYYGLDAMPTGNLRDFYSVALHELGHGFGFGTFVNTATGEKPVVTIMGVPTEFDDPYMAHLENHSTGVFFPAMTDAERVAAAKNGPNLHWVGPRVIAASGYLTAGRTPTGHVEMYAPGSISASSVAHFSTSLEPDNFMEPSYVGPNHDLALTYAVLADMGWSDCGNGVINAGEGCDDDNLTNGDGCSVTCQIEECYVCAGEPSVCGPDNGAACDDEDACTTGDVCSGTTCAGTPSTGNPCDDADLCTINDVCTAGVCGGTQTCTLDHFLTYKVKVTSGTPKFAAIGSANGTVDLTSDFATSTIDTHDQRGVTVKKPVALGLPADKNGEGILDPMGVNGLHLEEYQVKTVTAGSFVPSGYTVTVQNQCGTVQLTGFKPATLLVPTAKNLTMAVGPPVAPALDHFECYTAKLTSSSPKLAKGTQVVVTDQFMTNWRLDLKKVKKLCVPVDKQGTPLDKSGAPPAFFTPATRDATPPPRDSLLCYPAKRASKAITQNGCGPQTPGDPGVAITQPKHTKVLGMFANNQLGPLRLDSVKENELCIPSVTTCANCP
jgi:cysteine-rich repeat protein